MRGKLQGTPIRRNGEIVGWRVRVGYQTETGARQIKGFDRKTLREAQGAAIRWLSAHGRVHSRASTGTVQEAIHAVSADLWHQLAPHTRDNYQRCADLLAQEFGDRDIAEVTAPQLTAYFKRFATGSKRMMAEHWKVAKAVFGYAASDLGWLPVSPSNRIQQTRVPHFRFTSPH